MAHIHPPRVFFDSDALIAGSASRQGAAFLLLQLSEIGLIEGFTCQQVLAECHKNLEAKLPEAIVVFKRIIGNALTVVANPSEEELALFDKMAHEKDLPILGAAIKTNVEFLITFNTKDFFPLTETGVTVLEPGQLLRIIRSKLANLTDK